MTRRSPSAGMGAPRYSSKGFQVPLVAMKQGLEQGVDHRVGRLRLGPKGTQGDGRLLVLARSVAGKAFDLLWLDMDADGSVADEEVRRVTSRTSRGNVYTSYTAREVVAAAKGIVCIKVDGDKRRDLKEAHKVSSLPTRILFDTHGKEVARFNGYRSVKDMAAFFQGAHAALPK